MITAAEQRIPLRDWCQLPVHKLTIYECLSKKYTAGRGRLEREARETGRLLQEPAPVYKPLTQEESRVVTIQWRSQSKGSSPSNGVSRQVVTLQQWQEYCANNRICKVLLVEGNYIPKSYGLLSNDSPYRGAPYALDEHHFQVTWCLNDFMDAWSKSYEDALIRQSPQLASRTSKEAPEPWSRRRKSRGGLQSTKNAQIGLAALLLIARTALKLPLNGLATLRLIIPGLSRL